MADLKSKIILVENINIDRSYTNVLSYSENQMLSLCQTNAIATASDYQFIRPSGSIYTNFTYSQCLRANYIAFQNKDYDNKWFFAFIDDVIYQGEENTEITFTVDSWSTWYSYWTKKNCYVIRHHVNDDTIGANTTLENIDIGDVVQEGETEEVSLSEYYKIAVMSSYNPTANDMMKQFGGVTQYTKQIFGKWIFLFSSASDLAYYIFHCNKEGHVADIQDIFYIPDALINQADLIQYTGTVEVRDNNGTHNQTYNFWGLAYSNTIESFNNTITKRHSFSDYQPKNNKCFVYPYNYLLVTNNNGNQNIFKYEDFTTSNCVFKIEGVVSVGNSIQCVPLNYRNMSRCDDEAIPVSKYPTIAWSSDAFTNWLTQNGVNMQTSLLNTILGLSLSALGSISSGANAGSGTSGAISSANTGQQAMNLAGSSLTSISGSVASMIGAINYALLLPNIQKGNNNGDINFQAGRNCITYREMRVKTEFLKIIDDYFSRFGYKIMRLTSPNITGRQNWNYLEISSSDEIGTGDVPTKYMEDINNACRRGVTIWHNHSNIGNYSLSNSIV